MLLKFRKINFFVPFLITLFLSSILLWSAQYWQLDLAATTLANKVTKNYIKFTRYRDFTFIVQNLIIIWLGFLFAQNIRCRYWKIVKTWLMTVLVSLTIQIVFLYLNKVFQNSTELYRTLFPILKNSYPLATGILLGISFLKITEKYLVTLGWRFLFLILIGISGIQTVFGQDPLGGAYGNGLIFGFALFSFGAVTAIKEKKMNPLFSSFIFFITSGCLILLNYWMPYISFDVHSDYSTASRFLNNGTLPAVLAAASLACLIFPHLKIQRGISNILGNFVYLSLLLANNTIFLSAVKTYLDKKFTNEQFIAKSMAVKEQTYIELGCLFIAIVIISLLSLLPINKKFNTQWLDFDFVRTLSDIKIRIFKNKHIFLGILWMLCLAYLSFVMVSPGFKIELNMGPTYSAWQYVLLARPMMIWINTLIIITFWLIIWGITNRYWLSTLGTTIIMIIILTAENLKIQARNEPILPSELLMIKASGALLAMISPKIILLAILGIILVISLVIILENRYPIGRLNHWTRLIIVICSLLFLSSSFFLNHNKGKVHIVSVALGNDPTFYNQLLGAQQNGPLLQFLNNVDTTIMEKPSGYSKARMNKIAQKYNLEAQKINITRTNSLADQQIVFSLSESFSDPRRVPGLTLSNNPIPQIQGIIKHNTSGLMLSSGYGGGTANIEYMTLTGLNVANFSPTLPTPYTQLVPFETQPWSFSKLFKTSTAIHPYQGVFYSRTAVYDKFGFQRFFYLGSKYKISSQEKIDRSPYLSDKTSFNNTLKILKETKQGQFIQLVSMQNHFPYDKDFYDGTEKYTADGPAASSWYSKKVISDFATGLSYTDRYVAEFIKQINQIQQPITIVFYGDHLPGIYYNNDMIKDGLPLHETDYFIYSNSYAQKHGALKKMKISQLVSPNDFPALVAKQTNAKVNGYLAFLTKLQEKLPAMSTNPKKI